MCAAGAVTLNGTRVRKANQEIRVGDVVVVPQGLLLRTIRVKALGGRRGPFAEARRLYDETAAPEQFSARAPAWKPLLADE